MGQTPVMHGEQHSIDAELTGKESCDQLRETIEKSNQKFRPHSL